MEKDNVQVFSTLDIYLAAFLSLQGLQPVLKMLNGKVTFNFTVSDQLYKNINLFNSNESISGFVTTVKTLRGQMLTMRGQR